MTNLYKISMVTGIADWLGDNGVITWPNKQTGLAVCEKIASALQGPEQLDTDGLSPQSALLIGQELKKASDAYIAAGYRPDAQTLANEKQAAASDLTDRAAWTTSYWMDKFAETSGTLNNTGPNTAQTAAAANQVAALDLRNRGTNEYLVGVGNTEFPNGGVVGKQMPAPNSRFGVPLSNSLTNLDKQAGLGDLINKLPESPEKTAAIKIAVDGTAQEKEALAQNIRTYLKQANTLAGEIVRAPSSAWANPNLGGTALNELIRAPASGWVSDQLGASHGSLSLLDKMKLLTKTHPNALRALGALGAAGGAAYGGKKLYDHLTAPKADPSAVDATKQSNEDMATQDLAAVAPGAPTGPTPGALQRALTFLQAMKAKIPGFRPDAQAQTAAGHLGEAGAPGIEVMAHVIEHCKTANDAQTMIAQILAEGGDNISPEMLQALQALMAEEDGDGAEGPPEAGPPEDTEAPPDADKEAAAKIALNWESVAKAAKGVGSNVRSVPGHVADAARGVGSMGSVLADKARAAGSSAANWAKSNPGKTLAGVGAGALTAGGIGGAMLARRGNTTEQKAAALIQRLKAAEGTLNNSDPNSAQQAAQHDQTAELDLKNRPPGKYLVGVGKTEFPNTGQILDIRPAPTREDVGVTDKVKSAADTAFQNAFQAMAQQYGGQLPVNMPEAEKVAHLQALMGVPPSQRPAYIHTLLQQ